MSVDREPRSLTPRETMLVDLAATRQIVSAIQKRQDEDGMERRGLIRDVGSLRDQISTLTATLAQTQTRQDEQLRTLDVAVNGEPDDRARGLARRVETVEQRLDRARWTLASIGVGMGLGGTAFGAALRKFGWLP